MPSLLWPICMGLGRVVGSLLGKKSACVYGGALDAVPHIHPYGTDEAETTFAHYSFKRKGEEKYVVFVEPLDSWRGKPMLLRPHAYMEHKCGVAAGDAWNRNVQA